MKEKFEIKPLEENPTVEDKPEIGTWENEGGVTKGPEEEPQEVFDKIE